MRTCPTCTKEFQTLGCAPQRHCSMPCYRRSNAETRLEAMVREELEVAGIGYVQEAKVGKYSVDFTAPDLGLAIEADGTYWHRTRKDSDVKKSKEIESHGFKLIRIEADTASDAARLALARALSLFLMQKLRSSGLTTSRRMPTATTSKSSMTTPTLLDPD